MFILHPAARCLCAGLRRQEDGPRRRHCLRKPAAVFPIWSFFNIIRWKKVRAIKAVVQHLSDSALVSAVVGELEQLSDWSKTPSSRASYSYKLWPAELCWLLCRPHVEVSRRFLFSYVCTSLWCLLSHVGPCCVCVLVSINQCWGKFPAKKSPRSH